MKAKDLIWIAVGAVALYYGYEYWRKQTANKKK